MHLCNHKSELCPLWLDTRERYPELDITSNVVPWLIRHAGWLIARFHTRSRDKLTPYKMITGGDYSHPVARFGEVVLGKIPKPQTRGVWLGKLDRDDSHILGTSSGAIAVRSVRRFPPESQTDSKMLEDMKGLPWQPRDGVRHRVTPEVSHAMPMPLPAATAADSPAQGDEILAEDKEEGENHPTLAVDGAKLTWMNKLSMQQPNWKNNLVHLTLRLSFLQAPPRSHQQRHLQQHHLHNRFVEQDGL